MLEGLCPVLTNLHLVFSPYDDLTWAHPVNWSTIKKLHIKAGTSGPHIQYGISQVPNLQQLTWEAYQVQVFKTKRNIWHQKTPGPAEFSGLSQLTISTPNTKPSLLFMSKLVGETVCPRVLLFFTDYIPHTGSPTSLINQHLTQISSNSLQHLVFKFLPKTNWQPEDASYAATFQIDDNTLHPLLRFLNIKSFHTEIFTRADGLTDHFMAGLALAWPNLTNLFIEGDTLYRCTPQCTSGVVPNFFSHCPNLSVLVFPFISTFFNLDSTLDYPPLTSFGTFYPNLEYNDENIDSNNNNSATTVLLKWILEKMPLLDHLYYSQDNQEVKNFVADLEGSRIIRLHAVHQ
jgi:hypothetical protein